MNDFQTILVICAVVLFIAAFAYYRMRADKKIIASIPEEFKYIYLCYSSYINFLAIDPRNKKMLLSLEGARKIYDFSDIQGYEKDSHVSKSTRNSKPISTTWYHLILHVNDPENPTWKFSSDLKDEFDCIEFLVSRALDGTLPDTDERRIFDIMNAGKCKLLLSTGTWAQEDKAELKWHAKLWRSIGSIFKKPMERAKLRGQVKQLRSWESQLKNCKDEDRAALLLKIAKSMEKDL